MFQVEIITKEKICRLQLGSGSYNYENIGMTKKGVQWTNSIVLYKTCEPCLDV